MTLDLTEPFDFEREYAFQEQLRAEATDVQWAVLELEQPITSVLGALLIASHLESDINLNACRLAFFGRLLEPLELGAGGGTLTRLKVYKDKLKQGQVDRVQDASTVIGRNLFAPTTDINQFVGMKVHIGPLRGAIASSFGKAKFKVELAEHELDAKGVQEQIRGASIDLRYRRYIFDSKKRMIQ